MNTVRWHPLTLGGRKCQCGLPRLLLHQAISGEEQLPPDMLVALDTGSPFESICPKIHMPRQLLQRRGGGKTPIPIVDSSHHDLISIGSYSIYVGIVSKARLGCDRYPIVI